MTGLVDRLEKAGYARRTRDPGDRRKVLVELVPNSRVDALLAAVFGPYGQDMAGLTGRYSAEEWAAIADWVERVTEILRSNTRRIGEPGFADTIES